MIESAGRAGADPLRPRIVLASRNRGKIKEFGRLLADRFVVEPVPEDVVLPEETGESFVENARLKATAVYEALGGEAVVLADDSGLEVDALEGSPGVRSARFAGEGASDRDNVTLLLERLRGVARREGRFVCALSLVAPSRVESPEVGGVARSGRDVHAGVRAEARVSIEVEGALEGTISGKPVGEAGFGYDPVFVPAGWRKTLGEASPGEKDAVSHRAAAVAALLARLDERGDADG